VPAVVAAQTVAESPAPMTTSSAVPAPPVIVPEDRGVIVSSASDVPPVRNFDRDRRYQELLRETSAAPKPPATASSSAAAPAGGRPAAAPADVKTTAKPPVTSQKQPAPVQAPPPRPAPRPVNPTPPPPEPRSYPGPDDQRAVEQNDNAESDIVAPQLLAMEFVPNTVQDGETTMLAVMAQDNLTGVRSISGVISGPSGTVQGFACQREGDSSRFVTRISIPKEAAAGLWSVKYLTLTDNASNSVNLNAAQGSLPASASFRVVASTSDTTAPSLKAVWLDRPAMRAGDRNTVFVQAEDDKTGVQIVSGVFVSPGKQARLAFGCRAGTTGSWECPLTPPNCLDCGVWHLEQLQLQDKANNMATVRSDNPLLNPVVVDISGDACDANPPALSMLMLDPLVVSNVEGGTIQVRATIADEGCGVASLSGQAVPQGNVGGQHAYFSMQPAGDGKTFVGTLTIEKLAAKGTWNIAWLQALDKGHNLRAYAATDPIVSRATFRVE
jgi:hypothetical protein